MARSSRLIRRKAVARILESRGDALLVAGLGSPSWDAAASGDLDTNFYLWGGMGGAVMAGLGLALAQPRRRVLVITGDGEMLMGLGSLATVGLQAPANLAVVVIDNERYGETGMQPTHTAAGIDLAGMAAAARWRTAITITDSKTLDDGAADLFAARGPVFAVVKVAADREPGVLPPRHGTYLMQRFRRAVLGSDADA